MRIRSRCISSSLCAVTLMYARRGVARLAADVDVGDDPVAAVLADVVEDAAEDAAVHQVPGDLHGLAGAHDEHTSAADAAVRAGLASDPRAVVAGVARTALHVYDEVPEAAQERADQGVAEQRRQREPQRSATRAARPATRRARARRRAARAAGAAAAAGAAGRSGRRRLLQLDDGAVVEGRGDRRGRGAAGSAPRVPRAARGRVEDARRSSPRSSARRPPRSDRSQVTA